MRQCENWLDAYLTYTDNSEPAEIFRRWCGISIISACLQRKCWIDWGPSPIYPNLYIIIIGPTSSRKSTAAGQALRFMMDPNLGLRLASDSSTLAALVREFALATTPYISQEGVIYEHSSMTVVAPEFTVFLDYNNIPLLTALTDWYDSEKNPWQRNTMSGGSVKITAPLLNVLGCTTPELLKSSVPVEAIGGGFLGRNLLIYAPRKEKTVVDPFETPEESLIRERLKNDLNEIVMLGGRWMISPKCLDFYRDWYNSYDQDSECQDPRFQGYFGRKPTTLRKVALVLSAARSSERVVNEEDIQLAYDLLTEIEERMYYCLQGVGRNQHAAVMNKMMLTVQARGEISESELMFQHRDDVTLFEFNKILEAMEKFQFCYRVLGTNKIRYNDRFSNGKDHY